MFFTAFAMALRAFFEGPRGFSLLASFMEPEIPSSLSSSSMGFPGGYGVREDTSSGTGSLKILTSGFLTGNSIILILYVNLYTQQCGITVILDKSRGP